MSEQTERLPCPVCGKPFKAGQRAYSLAVGDYSLDDEVIGGHHEATVCSKTCVRGLLPEL